MIREEIAKRGLAAEKDFRWRGGEITRVEGFSDAVFAFAVTLLVVSLEVPQTFTELLEAMRGFIAFAICFALLTSVWYRHYIFFRRYGLQDRYTTLLNFVLLFLMLFYVYPLKFVFTLLVNQMFGFGTDIALPNGATEPMIESSQSPLLFVIYGAGYVAVLLVFVLLYRHAFRQRAALELNAIETFDTISTMQGWLLDIGVGVISILIALIGGSGSAAWAGYAYFLIALERTIHGSLRGRQRRRLMQADRS